MKAVIVGAGRIGCGFAAHQLALSGYDLTVLGRGAALTRLRRHGGFQLDLTDGRSTTSSWIETDAVDSDGEADRVAERIADADLVCVAVGPAALPRIGALIAPGLEQAPRPLDVIAFENLEDAAEVVRDGVRDILGEAADRHGYSGAVVDRVVAQRIMDEDPDEPLRILGEPGGDVAVDRTALHLRFAPVKDMVLAEDFRAQFRSKLFRYSAGHATTAYLGALKGYRYVHAAIRDSEIRPLVRAAMIEGRTGVAYRYGEHVAGEESEIDRIIERFGNAALGDTVVRVGRDVPRKLAYDERLIGAARLAANAGERPVALLRAAATALLAVDIPPQARAARVTIGELTGLGRDHPFSRRLQREVLALASGGDGLMLSLQDGMWAWTAQDEECA